MAASGRGKREGRPKGPWSPTCTAAKSGTGGDWGLLGNGACGGGKERWGGIGDRNGGGREASCRVQTRSNVSLCVSSHTLAALDVPTGIRSPKTLRIELGM